MAQQQQQDDNNHDESSKTTASDKNDDSFNAQDHTEWGTYYDPQNIFCGDYDCYKILGFDYEEYDKDPPSRSAITKRYRALSRLWHPDKNKHKNAKSKFVKINRAYEVLTNAETRQEYDAMRYNQEMYFEKYGSSVLWSYAPHSDVTMIVIVLLALGSAVSWFAQQQKWQNVADKLTQAAVEDWGPREGGTEESKQLRQQAMELLEKQQQQQESQNETNADNNGSPKKAKKNKKIVTKEKKKQLEESLRPIVAKLVEEAHDDFGAGYHKPTWRDLLVVSMVQWPLVLVTGLVWHTKYFLRRLQKKELNDEERHVLTRRAVGEVTWASVSDEEKEEMVTLDLWNSENLQEWREAQEVKTWSVGDQKRYARMKKKGIKLHDE